MRKDIYGMLKNAMARGASMEKAKQSLINSGYPATEVEATVRELQGPPIPNFQTTTQSQIQEQMQKTQIQRLQQPQTQPQMQQQLRTRQTPVFQQPMTQIYQRPQSIQAQIQQIPQQTAVQPRQPLFPSQTQPVKKKKSGKVIFLIILLILLIGSLISAVIFRNGIIDSLSSLF